MITTLYNGELRNMDEATSCTDCAAPPIRAHRGAATLNNLVAGRWLSINESKQDDADRIQMSGYSDL